VVIRVLLPVLLLVACRTPAPRFATAPLATPVAAWIPADALMVIAIAPGGAAEVDALARALQVPEPGQFAAPGEVWILLDGDASSTARCAPAAAGVEAALLGKGGVASRAGGATLIERGDTITVLRDGVACTVASGAASRRARHAVRLATLAGEERLLARADARAALDALPADAAVVAWGAGDVVGGGVDAAELGIAGALGALGEIAVAVAIDPASHELAVTVVPADASRTASAPPRGSVGLIASPPGPPALAALPLPPRDENVDVPESPEYREAVQRLTRALFAAAELATEITARADAARAAWIAAWGDASITGAAAALEVRWTPPAWPPGQIRAAADAAYAAAHAGVDDLVARHAAAIGAAEALLPELVKIRARDVAAFDRARVR